MYLDLCLTKKVPCKIHSQYFCTFSIPGVLRKYMFQNLVLCRVCLPVNECMDPPLC